MIETRCTIEDTINNKKPKTITFVSE